MKILAIEAAKRGFSVRDLAQAVGRDDTALVRSILAKRPTKMSISEIATALRYPADIVRALADDLSDDDLTTAGTRLILELSEMPNVPRALYRDSESAHRLLDLVRRLGRDDRVTYRRVLGDYMLGEAGLASSFIDPTNALPSGLAALDAALRIRGFDVPRPVQIDRDRQRLAAIALDILRYALNLSDFEANAVCERLGERARFEHGGVTEVTAMVRAQSRAIEAARSVFNRAGIEHRISEERRELAKLRAERFTKTTKKGSST